MANTGDITSYISGIGGVVSTIGAVVLVTIAVIYTWPSMVSLLKNIKQKNWTEAAKELLVEVAIIAAAIVVPFLITSIVEAFLASSSDIVGEHGDVPKIVGN